LLADFHLSQPVNHKAENTYSQSRVLDREFNGEINQASRQGAKFALLLAMLEQDVLHRPKLLSSDNGNDANSEMNKALLGLSHYPPIPLKAETQHWQQANIISDTIHQTDIKQANLWLVMHPQPLSLHNELKRLDEEVVANCDVHTQHRLQDLANTDINVDETELYDILQGMEAEIETAA
jgi:hypothetical protein